MALVKLLTIYSDFSYDEPHIQTLQKMDKSFQQHGTKCWTSEQLQYDFFGGKIVINISFFIVLTLLGISF